MPSDVPPSPPALTGPLRRLLRPLVRLLIRRGVTFPVLAELLRTLYVEVATRDLLATPRERTDSRISVLTGVHRKEIRRLRTQETQDGPVPVRVTLGSQLIARWLASPGYADARGEPLALARVAGAPGAPSFETLVRAVTSDVRPRAVLEDWLGQGVVTLDAADRVRLCRSAYIPPRGSAEQMFYFARNLHDHIAAAAANVLAEGEAPFLERAVHYDRLSPAAAERLEALARGEARALLVSINRAAQALAEEDDRRPRPAGEPLCRVNLGVYLYAENDPAQSAPPVESPP